VSLFLKRQCDRTLGGGGGGSKEAGRAWGAPGLVVWKVPDRSSYREEDVEPAEVAGAEGPQLETGSSRRRRWFDSFAAVPPEERADWQDIDGKWHNGQGVIRETMFPPPSASPLPGAAVDATGDGGVKQGQNDQDRQEGVAETEAWVAGQLPHCVRCLPTDCPGPLGALKRP
jgi:hypothetical protein